MPRFGFCGPSYTSQSLNCDAQETINWYYEPDETGKGNSEGFLYPSPGEKVFVNLNPVSPAIHLSFDTNGGNFGGTDTIFISASSATNGEIAFALIVTDTTVSVTPNPGAGWNRLTVPGTSITTIGLFWKIVNTGFLSITIPLGIPAKWAADINMFAGVPPPVTSASVVQSKSIFTGTLNGAPLVTVGSFDANVTDGNSIFVLLTLSNAGSTTPGTISISDNHGNTYGIDRIEDSGAGLDWWRAANVAGGPTTITVTTNSGAIAGVNIAILEIKTT